MIKLTKTWYLEADDENWILIKRHEPDKSKGAKAAKKPWYSNEYFHGNLKSSLKTLADLHVKGGGVDDLKTISRRQAEIKKVIERVLGFEITWGDK